MGKDFRYIQYCITKICRYKISIFVFEFNERKKSARIFQLLIDIICINRINVFFPAYCTYTEL